MVRGAERVERVGEDRRGVGLGRRWVGWRRFDGGVIGLVGVDWVRIGCGVQIRLGCDDEGRLRLRRRAVPRLRRPGSSREPAAAAARRRRHRNSRAKKPRRGMASGSTPCAGSAVPTASITRASSSGCPGPARSAVPTPSHESGARGAAEPGGAAIGSTASVTRVPHPEGWSRTEPDARSPSHSTTDSGSVRVMRISPNSPRWRVKAATSDSSAHNSGGLLTRVRVASIAPGASRAASGSLLERCG